MGKTLKKAADLGAFVYVKDGLVEHPAHLVIGGEAKKGEVMIQWDAGYRECVPIARVRNMEDSGRSSRRSRQPMESAPAVSTKTRQQSVPKKKPVPKKEPVPKKTRLVKFPPPQHDKNKATAKSKTDKSEAAMEGVQVTVDEATMSVKRKTTGAVEKTAIPRKKDNTANKKSLQREVIVGSRALVSHEGDPRSKAIMLTKSTHKTPSASVNAKKPQSNVQASKMDEKTANSRSKERKRNNLTGPKGTSTTTTRKPSFYTSVMSQERKAPKDGHKAESTSRTAGRTRCLLKDNARGRTGKARASELRKDISPAKRVSQAASSAQEPLKLLLIGISSDDENDTMMKTVIQKKKSSAKEDMPIATQTEPKSEEQLNRSVQIADRRTICAERMESHATVSADDSATQSTGQASQAKRPLDVPPLAINEPTKAVQRPHAEGKKRRVQETAGVAKDGGETAGNAGKKVRQMDQPEALPPQLGSVISSKPDKNRPRVSLTESNSEVSGGSIFACVEKFYNDAPKDQATVGDIIALVERELGVKFLKSEKKHIQQHLKDLALRDAEQAYLRATETRELAGVAEVS